VLGVDFFKQHLDEEPKAWTHSSRQCKSPHNFHGFSPQFAIGVTRFAYSRKLKSAAHPDMLCFFIT
jgi:hypothetical protein